jgi:hypothetical protein
LEGSHSSCHYATKTRRVQINGESVNCVGLEEEHQCQYRRLLVACGVQLSQTRQLVSLRHTSLMPSIRGLPTLVAILFAPTIELRLSRETSDVTHKRTHLFRLDEQRQTKSGVLCGLGFNPVTNTSLYPDHDMDMAFDVHVSTEDIVRVRFACVELRPGRQRAPLVPSDQRDSQANELGLAQRRRGG